MQDIINKFGNCGCFFIAEIGNNHQGDLNLAKKMVIAAKNSGASAVKFQKRDNRNLMQRELAYQPYQNRNSFGANYLEHREAVELSIQDFFDLKAFCEMNEILFFATPFDAESLEQLTSIYCELFKVASADIVNTELLKKISQKGKPIILSTGGATIKEVDEAVELIQSYNLPLSVLQCTAVYPCDTSDMNLNVLRTFETRYENITLGISDHQSGISMALIAYMLGARVFEKHFTLHRSWKGTDQAFSLEPEGFRKMVRDITAIDSALGSTEKTLLPVENDAIFKMRKSIVLKEFKSKGEVLNRNDLEFKCPGNGMTVNKMKDILGRTAVRNLPAGTVLSRNDFDV